MVSIIIGRTLKITIWPLGDDCDPGKHINIFSNPVFVNLRSLMAVCLCHHLNKGFFLSFLLDSTTQA